jgi:hypothetical protein
MEDCGSALDANRTRTWVHPMARDTPRCLAVLEPGWRAVTGKGKYTRRRHKLSTGVEPKAAGTYLCGPEVAMVKARPQARGRASLDSHNQVVFLHR